MPDTAIRVENLSKRYRIGLKESRPETLAAALASWLRVPARNLRNLRRLSTFDSADDPFVIWALKDVSFEVKQGVSLGLPVGIIYDLWK